MTELSKYHSWSLLDPRPICFYDKRSGTHLAVWNGVYMTRNQAMMIACEKWLGVWPTPTMKKRGYNEFIRAYYAGGFGDNDWDMMINNNLDHGWHYNKLQYYLRDHLKSMQKYSGSEVLKWFNLHKENENGNTSN